jgi:hypothetical protein
VLEKCFTFLVFIFSFHEILIFKELGPFDSFIESSLKLALQTITAITLKKVKRTE